MDERILVVDDEESVALTLSALLDREGYQTVTASTLDEALARVEAHHFDVVLLDLMLAGEDGLQVLARLRESSPETAAIVLSGYGTLASATRAIQLGVSEYLTKPCPIDELKAAVTRGLERRREILGARRALAEERERLLVAERAARVAAEEHANRNARLQAVTAALSRAISVADVGRAIAEQAVAATGANAGALGVVLGDGEAMTLAGAAGYSDDPLHHFARFPFDASLPMTDVARTRAPLWVSGRDAFYARYPHLTTEPGRARIAAVPLDAGDRLLGAISLSFPDTRDFTPEEQEFILAVARECARALERARLSDDARRARAQAEAAQHRLRELFLAAPAFIAVTRGPEHIVEIVNARFLALVGIADPSAVLGKPVREAFPEFVPTGYVALADRVYASGEIYVNPEMPARRDRDGDGIVDSYWTSVVIQPYRDETGEVIGLLFHGVDVTEQALARHVAQRAADRTSRLQSITAALARAATQSDVAAAIVTEAISAFEAGAAAVIALGPDGSFETILRVGYAETPGAVAVHRNWSRFPLDAATPAGDAVRQGELVILSSAAERVSRYPHLADVSEAAGEGTSVTVPLLINGHPVGALHLGFAETRPLDLDDQALLLTLGRLCAQAFERARLLTAEQTARTEAEAAIRVRDDFLGIAAHELKTPVAGLRGSAQLLLRQLERAAGVDPERLRLRLEVIDQQSARLARLVNQLLDVSRLEAGRLILDRAPTDVTALVTDVVSAAQGHTDRHAISVAGDAGIVASVDAFRLEQVVSNLVDNAIKYSPDGGSIQLRVWRPSPDEVAIGVADQGIGIPPEHRDQIFNRFFQAHASGHYSGMGLGLYISQEIIQLHRGRIDVEFPDEGGTRFVVRLPVSS